MSQPGALYCYCGNRVPFLGIVDHLAKCPVRMDNSPLATLSRRLKESSSLEQLKLYLQELQAEHQIVANYIASKEAAGKPVPVLVRPVSAAPQPIVSAERVRGASPVVSPVIVEEVKRPPEPRFERRPPPKPPSPEPVEEGVKCSVCGKVSEDFSGALFLDCSHIVCKRHICESFEEEYKRTQRLECPVRSCPHLLSINDIKDAVGEDRFDSLMMALALGDNAGVVAECKNCGLSIQLEPERVDYHQKDQNGVAFSREAAEHFAKFRFRCPKCSNISCANCKEAPYHEGKTCEQFAAFKVAKKCRFCGEKLPSGKEGCMKVDCRERMARACKKVLRCGHSCYGVHEESACPPCLSEACNKEHNEFEYCSICYTEGLGSAPVVQLACNHLLHQHCIMASLNSRWIGPRITFKFALCPSCSEWAFTPHNREILAKVQLYKALFDDVADKAVKRLKHEGEDKDPRILDPTNKHYYNQPQKFAMDRLCYYECFKCKKPYFGGKKDCARNDDGKKFDPTELVCPSCVAESMPGTANCGKHGTDFIEFKCKFCCNIAAWFCWGNTHFCEDCHTKQNAGDYVSRKARDQLPKCKGPATCPLKIRHPPNGEEFALGCSMCRNQVGDF